METDSGLRDGQVDEGRGDVDAGRGQSARLVKRAKELKERLKAEEEIRVWQRGSHRGYVR